MKRLSICALALSLGMALVPHAAIGQTTPVSNLHLSSLLSNGHRFEKLSVTAKDLTGRPLAHAAVTARVHYGSRTDSLHLHRTDSHGRTSTRFQVPSKTSASKAAVDIMIRSGFLQIPLYGSFALSTSGKPGSKNPTAVPTGSVIVVLSSFPTPVMAPSPAWIVVHAISKSGINLAGAQVEIQAHFKEGVQTVKGTTDSYGLATLKLDTSKIRSNESVKVTALVKWQGHQASSSTTLSIQKSSTATTPGPETTATPTAAATPVPTAAPTAGSTTATATPVPTPTTLPTSTSTPLPTNTPVPTWTPVPTPTAAPTASPTPLVTPTLVPAANCPPPDAKITDPPQTQLGCMQLMLNILNQTRAANGVAPLTLDLNQSYGTSTCMGSYGNSLQMAQNNSLNGHANFPADICDGHFAGENIAGAYVGDEPSALQAYNNLMMSEPHGPQNCVFGYSWNHACNILNPGWSRVGIGIVYNGSTWVTQDFE